MWASGHSQAPQLASTGQQATNHSPHGRTDLDGHVKSAPVRRSPKVDLHIPSLRRYELKGEHMSMVKLAGGFTHIYLKDMSKLASWPDFAEACTERVTQRQSGERHGQMC